MVAAKRLARRGTTLVELMCVLVLLAFIALGTGLLISSATRATDDLRRQAREFTRNASSRVYVRELFAHSIDFAADTALPPQFSGNEFGTDFRTWCRSPDGSRRSCDARMVIEDIGTRSQVTMQAGGASFSYLLRGKAHLVYLDPSSAVPRWLTTWDRSQVLPAAVGLVGDLDTIAYVVAH